MKEIGFISEAELVKKLNPYFLRKLRLENKMPVYEVDPYKLLNSSRFDIVAKYIYAKFYEHGIASDFADKLYTEHIRIFNNFVEPDGYKNGINDFKASFDQLLDSVRDDGFDTDKSIIPIGLANAPIDGGHRLAASLFYNQKVAVVPFDRKNNNFNYKYFRRKGLSKEWCDSIALEYCRLKKKAYILCTFPSSIENKQVLDQFLFKNHELDLYYNKTVQLSPIGIQNIIKELYGDKIDKRWLNNLAANYKKSKGKLTVFAFEADSNHLDTFEEITGDNQAFILSKSHDETLNLAQTFFNENSLLMLNKLKPSTRKIRLNKLLNVFGQWVIENNYDKEHFCMDGSAVMAAFGLDDARYLRYFQFGNSNIKDSVNPSIRNYNRFSDFYSTTIDDLIFNPNNHFYYKGFKFISLDHLKKMSATRGKSYDQRHIKLLNSIIG